MYNIKTVHIELTDRCQAACPMCSRNHNGGGDRLHISNNEVTLEDFVKWFPADFLKTLDLFYSSGNYGDPVFAKDCLEIFSYIRNCNPNIHIAIHTNGSLRTAEWWTALAKVIGINGRVIFAVDGFKGKHELYRKNTDFEKIIDNIKTFIASGGIAKVNSLVFAHNEYEIEDLEYYLNSIGVKEVEFRSTTRFYDMKSFPVYDRDGNHQYDILPASIPKYKKQTNITLDKFLDKDYRQQFAENAIVDPKCKKSNEIYVDCRGNVFPCSYVGSDYVETGVEETSTINVLRNITTRNTQEFLNIVGVPNLKKSSISDLQWNNLEMLWSDKNKCLTCVNICSSSVYG